MLVITALSLLGALLIQVPEGIADNQQLYEQWVESVAKNKVGDWASVLSALGLFDVFHSIWFIIAGVLLILNIILCNINRWSSIRTILRGAVVNRNREFYTGSSTGVELPIDSLTTVKAAAVSAKYIKARGYRINSITEGDIVYQAADKNRVFRLGTYVSHLSLILFIFAFIAGNYFGFKDTTFTIPEQSIRPVGHDTGLTLELISYEDEYYEDGRPKDFRSDVILYENGQVVATDIIRVNHPLSYKGIRFYQSYYGPAVTLGVYEMEGKELFNDGVELDRTLVTSGYLHYEGFFDLSDKGLTVRVIKAGSSAGSPMIPSGHIAVDIRKDGNQIALKLVKLGTPELVSGLEFNYYRESQYSGFQVSHDPANSLIWIASALFIIGICAVLYFPYRQIWVRIESVNGDETQLIIRSTDSRREVLTGDFQKFVAGLRKELSGHRE